MRITLRMRWKEATGEWVVRVWKDGIHSEDAAYYTDDKQDAFDTMLHMAVIYDAKGHNVETIKPKNMKGIQ